ncbi:MAG: UvrD-helicase domain-containing protein, partial [Balneolaceae bacterium]
MSTRPFDIFVEKLHSRMLVEASAGTGKTYNIVGLYVRLLIEKNLNVNRILVVTFTRMATRELKERLYSRLKESLKVSTDGEYKGRDPFLKKLSDFCRQHENSSDILRKAIRNFDEAQVLTIHGFCQKVLKEEALASGMPFDFDVVQSDRFLVEAAQDFWRWFVDCHSQSRAGRYYINLVSSYGATPEELVRTLKPLFTKPYARTEPEHTGVEGKEVSRLQSIIDKREEIRTLWRQERDVILEEMFNSDVSGMGKKKVEKWGLQFDTFAEDSNFKEDQPKNLKKFTSSYLNNEENLKKNGEKIPVHPLFDLCDEYASLVEQIPEVKTSFLLYACREIRRLRKQKTREASQLSYEDLLTLLKRALTNPSGGSQLATRLRKKYPVALVDEFQDTDPIQYHIFNRIYEQNDDENTLLMLIGDPKQAIYGFRGADVYAYLRARESVKPEQSFTLTKNYRSSEGLIAGVNALFSSSPDPFIEEKISFSPAQKGELPAEKKLTYTRQTNAPLQIYFRDGISTGSESRRHLFEIAGDQVAELIRDGKKGNARVGENPLQAGDIAILVSRHRDASDLKECLKARGVDSITYSRKKVFESREARRLRRLMGAVLYPSDRRRVQTALVSGFFGVEIEHLYEMQQNDEEWETLNDHLRSLNERWYESGFYPMFRKILFENKALEHFARIQDSERVITNLQQLAEICSYAELDHEFDPSGLYYWFCKQVAEP